MRAITRRPGAAALAFLLLAWGALAGSAGQWNVSLALDVLACLLGSGQITAGRLFSQTTAATDTTQNEQAHDRPFLLRHQPDSPDHHHRVPARMMNGGMKDERAVVVPPAPQEASATAPPTCPKNSRFSFCAVDPVCADRRCRQG